MKARILIIVVIAFVLFGLCKTLYAWESRTTHPAITAKAVGASSFDNYLKTKLGLKNGIISELHWDFPPNIKERIKGGKAEPEKTTRTILEWLRVGSTIEDEDGRIWPIRSRHHFHDPYRNAGLDNQTDHNDWEDYACTKTGFDLTGESAMVWAIQGTAPNQPTINDESWQDARVDFYAAFTQAADANRETFLARTFLDLGCVLHMIEDLGVPAHTRNDFLFGHYRTWTDHSNPLEGWVEEQIIDTNGQSSWSGIGPVVFDKSAEYSSDITKSDSGE